MWGHYVHSGLGPVDFSINFFVTGSHLLMKTGSGIKNLADVASKRAGAAEGTTNEQALRAYQSKASAVTFQDRPLGFLAFEQGRIVAYVADLARELPRKFTQTSPQGIGDGASMAGCSG